MEKTFAEVAVGEKFTVNNVEYVKTEDVRVSCCKVINAYAANDASQKAQFPGNITVTING
jgi:hypothetical protein